MHSHPTPPTSLSLRSPHMRHVRINPRRPNTLSRELATPSFVTPVQSVRVRARQLARSLQFWRRVLTIWASFKATQVYIALQRRHRTSEWRRKIWERQHAHAGDVCSRLFSFCDERSVKKRREVCTDIFSVVWYVDDA